MSLERRRSLVETTTNKRAGRFTSSSLTLPVDITEDSRLKVWEERPLSPYTYAQLYWGEVAIGARILVYRWKLFAKRESAGEGDVLIARKSNSAYIITSGRQRSDALSRIFHKPKNG